MSTIVPSYRSVQQLLKNTSYSIDEYQREYKREKKHTDALLDDLHSKFTRCYRDGDATTEVAGYEDYFLGSINTSDDARSVSARASTLAWYPQAEVCVR